MNTKKSPQVQEISDNIEGRIQPCFRCGSKGIFQDWRLAFGVSCSNKQCGRVVHSARSPEPESEDQFSEEHWIGLMNSAVELWNSKPGTPEPFSAALSETFDDLDPFFQRSVKKWTDYAFGEEVSKDKVERNNRFMEEALELVQAAGMTKEQVLMLVDYTFSRPAGEISQEVGGVITTFAALSNAHGINMTEAGSDMIEYCWRHVDAIRAKHKSKPRNSPLPGSYPTGIQPHDKKHTEFP